MVMECYKLFFIRQDTTIWIHMNLAKYDKCYPRVVGFITLIHNYQLVKFNITGLSLCDILYRSYYKLPPVDTDLILQECQSKKLISISPVDNFYDGFYKLSTVDTNLILSECQFKVSDTFAAHFNELIRRVLFIH